MAFNFEITRPIHGLYHNVLNFFNLKELSVNYEKNLAIFPIFTNLIEGSINFKMYYHWLILELKLYKVEIITFLHKNVY